MMTAFMMTATDELSQKLSEDYGQLSPLERGIVQLLSIVYEPCTMDVLYHLTRKIKIRIFQGRISTIRQLAVIVGGLKEKGFLDDQLKCHESFREKATWLAVEAGYFNEMVRVINAVLPPLLFGMLNNPERCVREIRIGIYRRDPAHTLQFLELGYQTYPEIFAQKRIFTPICQNPFRPAWFRKLPMPMKALALEEMADQTLQDLSPIEEVSSLLREHLEVKAKDYGCFFRSALATLSMFRGQGHEALQIARVDKGEDIYPDLIEAWWHFLQGDNSLALTQFEAALKQYKKAQKRKNIFFWHIGGLFFMLAMLKAKEPQYLGEILDHIQIVEDKQPYNKYLPAYRYVKAVVFSQQNHTDAAKALLSALMQEKGAGSLSQFFSILTSYWLDRKLKPAQMATLKNLLARAMENGYLWFAFECANLLKELLPEEQSYGRQAEELGKTMGLQSIVNIVQYEEDWERSLRMLTNLHLRHEGQSNKSTSEQSRLVWLLGIRDDYVSIQAKEQKLLKSGKWSQGRFIPNSRLLDGQNLPFMTPQDHNICSSLMSGRDYWSTSYFFDWPKALKFMVGHPLLFLTTAPHIRLDLVQGQLELLVEEQKGQYLIKLSEPDILDRDILLVKEGLTKYKVIEVTPHHKQIAQILGQKGLLVPAAAKEKVLEAITSVSSMLMVHSAIEAKGEDIEEVTADSQIYIHLLPSGAGFRLEMLVKPLARGGPYLKPGIGGENLIAEIEGKRFQTKRCLGEEKNKAEEVMAACPLLLIHEEYNWEWLIKEAEDCLQILLDLQRIEGIRVEWPEGERFKITHPMSFEQLKLRIKKERDWFSASGELQIDSSRVLDMQRLLELMQNTSSRFIPLGEGEFLALTDEFRRRLEDLKSFSEKAAKGVRFHPLASLALRELAESAGTLDVDEAWQEQLKRIDQAKSLDPKIPSTLQANLRDYQIEGYKWLMQLSHWGVGACLADDMGLGKTVQALAVILERAGRGPSLVVAPTSVCANWLEEAQRFTPTLRVTQFVNRERKKHLEGLGAYDVLVTSYGLLQQETEILAEVKWQVIVLDEAQAIKNMATKRSQAAMTLQGEFKMITTGTPVENHLGELWNLFRFINPGLLGSRERFNERLATPIEKYQDKEARRRLKRLIQPFILRRIKSQVLEELPPRTEITLHVEMREDEVAFYEALRQQALERLAGGVENPAGQRHLQILAEIMRLRRACCNTRLVSPELNIESSKLALLSEVLDELLENRHKALVFSQFVDHLDLIRELLDRKGVRYQYLDGSTPARERKDRIDAFQSGEGDLFLISLRAGGLGLNLTAADYVIHMDPWWNPAVEDQASDRAHRIGQERPVTIYRLITRNTIEEKIASLHREKRDLATTLLEGSEVAGKMSADELLHLIKEAG